LKSFGSARRCPTSKQQGIIIMSTRLIRQLSSVSALVLGSLACGPVDSEQPLETQTHELTTARQTGTVDLLATQDARTQAPSEDGNFDGPILWTNTQGHQSFVAFDLTTLPVDAIIESAELRLYFNGHYAGVNTVDVGQVEGAWDETTLTWNNQPTIAWTGPSAEVGDAAADISWDVTEMARNWHAGRAENYGFGLRSLTPGGKQFWSREAVQQLPPRLVIKYSLPVTPKGPFPDSGDAPDSTNHHGVLNSAYPGVPGNFPTVYQVPAGQAAGPRHDNITLQAFLGNFISREQEADAGPDADGPNNILRNAAGLIGNVADQDRGDDGWRNRNFRFYNCLKQTLKVRVSRPLGATKKQMYLNTWFDGLRDGDFGDAAPCTPPSGGPVQASSEWIVRNHPVDLTQIAPGSFADLDVPTERVLNLTEGLPHWMRFTLSEAPAVTPPVGLPDGRGPHPLSAAKSFALGETEDVLQIPPPPGQLGNLVLEKRVVDAEGVVPQGGVVTYEIRLKNEGGSGPAPAYIRDQLPSPLHPSPFLPSGITVRSPGGAFPLEANLAVTPGPTGAPEIVVLWDGELAPNSEVTVRFQVHVHPTCVPFQAQRSILNVARAGGFGAPPVSAQASFLADCPGQLISQPIDSVDLSALPTF
jgi:hypothetical protein